jgi:hypothetical protein
MLALQSQSPADERFAGTTAGAPNAFVIVVSLWRSQVTRSIRQPRDGFRYCDTTGGNADEGFVDGQRRAG